MEAIFWSAIIFVFYSYLGYPVLLIVLGFLRNRSVKKGDITPNVSLIITAYNEEKRIREKIENALQQDYPRGRLEILVASDCSEDRTDEIVRSLGSKGVQLVRAERRGGKEAAQKLAVNAATGEVLVFSDVATILPPNAITNIVKNFYDPTVGCVSSVDRVLDSGSATGGEGIYVKYEMLLRNLETRVGTLVGLSGSFFAARREVCQNWQSELQSDFNTLLNAVHLGLRGVSDPESVGYYKNIADETREYERKVRTVLRGISVFMKGLPMLNPFRYGIFSWQLLSHKLCRWLVSIALIFAFVSNAFLIHRSSFYLSVFVLQLAFYALALGGVRINPSSRNILKIPSFFVLVNLSILTAWFRYLRGQRIVTWEPSER
jgi:cellulose synthase/poly-beta-1,6-N-acetylglucosamine synthase-like glycosyltransferase